MTSRTRTSSIEQAKTAKATTARKAAKKTTTARPARKTPAKKTAPRLSLVKPTPTQPKRPRPFMTDIQGFATLAARIAGITTPNIRDWRDHRDGTTTRRLPDGALLHYRQATRTLTWQGTCPMGAIHEHPITSPSTTTAARVDTIRCTTPHADLSTIPALTADELAGYGLHHSPTTVRPVPGDDPITETIPVALPASEPEPRTLADTLVHSDRSNADTQPLNRDDITAGLTAPADTEKPKEHPQP
ncbi:hypothetical protein ACFC08_28555 [Streptomyces sp. NPDC056112]|uniref:hypothetical protein n=1 Tax=Streptomyces sp. NPDC056112 TaxID=3345715 RepID=UPI0035D62631